MREIIVSFDNGKVEIETKGFVGSDCLKATAALEKALGVKTSDDKTAEFHTVKQNVEQTRKAGR